MQNLYFRNVIKRENPILKLISGLGQILEGPPRLLLCVFLRKDMGERHFNIASASTLGFALFLPFVFYIFGAYENSALLMWTRYFNVIWGLFVIGFMAMSYRHHKEQGFSLTRYDFDKFSLHEGRHNLPWERLLSRLNLNPELTPILIEIVLEPLIVFIAGFVLVVIPFSRAVGVVLILSSIAYSISYIGAYWRSRNDLLDKNDEGIMNRQFADVLIGDVEIPDLPENTRIKMPPIMPEKKEHKKRLYNQIVVETMGVQ
ncbi:MAG: hypothetical protein ABJF04_09305 [Reichenbachiella sp.]|uniref:hypothetical protein n=1 Tax=Reichenbachiella sp. TaxID=2184521 RepID=UPI003265EDBE